jgi:quercetin 2,3-dioxygenase
MEIYGSRRFAHQQRRSRPVEQFTRQNARRLKPFFTSIVVHTTTVSTIYSNTDMKTVYHPSGLRGHANHGWLKTWHSFSFAGWYDAARINFGALRVLNDDMVAPGMGFPTHPHDNMEIVTLMMKGELEHQDSMGNREILRRGEVQAMSAGTGIRHSERNASETEPLHLFQIWVFPRANNTKPRYDQKQFLSMQQPDSWQLLVSPDGADNSILIGQDAWFSTARLSQGKELEYTMHKEGNGAYVFVIEGSAEAGGEILSHRDAAGITETAQFSVKASEDLHLLVIEVPMEF